MLSDPTASGRLKRWIFAGTALQWVGVGTLLTWSLLGWSGVVKQLIRALMSYDLGWLVVMFPVVPVSLYLTGIVVARVNASRLRELRSALGERACINCGYSFEGLKPHGNCPECGQTYDGV